jgi:hypothetical protein
VRDLGILGLIDRAEMYRTNSHVHQKAHPEKRHNTRLNWTDGDKGIYVADRVAGDDNTRGDEIRGLCRLTSAAAVVSLEGQNATRIACGGGLVDSAYTMELLAGVYAHLTTDRGTIHSDCTSAISTIKKWLLGWKVSVRDVC